MSLTRQRKFLPGATLAAGLTFLAGTVAPVHAGGQKRPNIVQRHPTMTGIAAGVATRHALKRSAERKKATGRKLNFAERHPTLTGVGAALGTRHVIKRTTRR